MLKNCSLWQRRYRKNLRQYPIWRSHWLKKGLSVMQIGCDPKADSTIALRDGEPMPAVLDIYNEKKWQCDFERDYKNRIQRSCLCGVRRTDPGTWLCRTRNYHCTGETKGDRSI